MISQTKNSKNRTRKDQTGVFESCSSSMFHRNTIKVAIPQRILVIDHKTMTLDTLEMKRLDASDRNGNPCEVECEMYSLKYSTGTSLVCQVEKDITVFDSLKIEHSSRGRAPTP